MSATPPTNSARQHTNPGKLSPRALTLALVLSLIATLPLAPIPAQAATRASDPSTTVKAPKKRVKIKQQRSSAEESTAERDRRMFRECRGLPNAGACRGYTQQP